MHHAPCLEVDDEKSKEGSKEEIGHLQARHTPRCVPRGCAGRSPSSALLVVVSERVACTPEWCVCTHESRVEVNRPEYAQHPTVDF
jgi:hypothetical protein